MTVRFFLHFGGKRAVKPRKGGSLPAGETWGGFLGLRSLGLPTAVSLHSPALRSLALRMGRHSHIWMDFPLVGLSRRHTHGLIIAEMVVYPLPAPLLPPCLPRGLEMLTVSLCFNHFSQKGKKNPTKRFWSSWRDESVISWNGRSCTQRPVGSILKDLQEANRSFPSPEETPHCPEKSRESGSLMLRKCFPQPVTVAFSLSKNYH